MLEVLLLEDNPADADLLQELLRDAGDLAWKITHVEYLSAAIEQLKQQNFDVVLSDLSLPDAQGLDTVVKIHTLIPDLPIIVLTGLNNEEIGLEALRKGAQDYLAKGYMQPELLVRTVRYAIERSQNQRIMYQQAAAMAASMEGIAILNGDREHIYVNQAYARLYGYNSPDELIGTLWHLLYDVANYSVLEQKIDHAIQQQGYWHGETLARRGDQEFYQELSITALKEGGFVCNAQDITERKLAEAEILKALERERELNELKSHFVSIVSHEFRTPLATILSAAEILQKYGHRDVENKNQIRYSRIINGVHRMRKLLDDVLIFNKAEAGTLQFTPELLNLTEFCRELVDEIQSELDTDHYINLVNHSCYDNYLLDEQLLRYILTNLISNAVKYSLSNSNIYVQCTCQPGQVEFSVRDEGIGIPAADRERLFVVFHRGSNVGTIPGTGLGLAIVKRCVELHGGNIAINSEPGKGTDFTVTLPCSLKLE